MENTLAGSVKPVTMVEAQAATGTTTGSAVDSFGFESLTIIVSAGSVTSDLTVTVKESDSASTGFTNVAADDLFGSFSTITSGDSNKQFWVGYFGKKRYVKVSLSGGADVAVTGLLGHPKQAPTLGPNADVQFANYG